MPEQDVIRINFIEDGLTGLGKVWCRGEELEVVRGSAAWKRTVNAKGESWLDMDEDAQMERFGSIKFRHGPWRGKSLIEAQLVFEPLESPDTGQRLPAPTPAQLKEAERKRQQRKPPPAAKVPSAG